MSSFVYTYGGIRTGIGTTSFFPLSSELNKDKFFSGIYITDTVYITVKQFDILYYSQERKRWGPARANSISTMPARGVALDSEYGGGTIRILLFGGVYNDAWSFTDHERSIIYLGQQTAGTIETRTNINILGMFRQPIGQAVSRHQAFFHFTGVYLCNDRTET